MQELLTDPDGQFSRNYNRTPFQFPHGLKGLPLFELPSLVELAKRMPDHRDILQTFVWQDYGLAPKFPKLIKFRGFWSHNLDGPLASVRVAHAGIIQPVQMHYVGTEWRLH